MKMSICRKPKNYLVPFIAIFLIAVSCNGNKTLNKQDAIEEIRRTEYDFARMASDSGVTAAFLFYADSDAVLQRGDTIIKGITGIREYFSNTPASRYILEWAPEFVDVASSCDLGYTYGYYRIIRNDSTGKTVAGKGIFHTVWKRQEDGSWKFVWD